LGVELTSAATINGPVGPDRRYEWFRPYNPAYDTSGIFARGPAPFNLAVPEYAFLTDTKEKIG
jgi:hypothetical protein